MRREVESVRFVWAVVAFILAALMIGGGMAQRTVLMGSRTIDQTVQSSGDAPYLLIDGGALGINPGVQTIKVEQAGPLRAYYGRTVDLEAWLQKSDYEHATRVDTTDTEEPISAISTSSVPASIPLGDGETAPTMSTSDLWLDTFESTDALTFQLQLPEDMSLLLVTDETAPAPASVVVSWPSGVSTPWAGPLIVGGTVLFLVGLVLYILGVRHARRAVGPRRKALPPAETEPIELTETAGDKGVISATPTRRSLSRGRKRLAVVPVLALTGLVVSGCSAGSWPQFDGESTPSPSASVIVPVDQGAPAVTETQAARILSSISAQVARADEGNDAEAAAQRLTGAALAVRKTNYQLRSKIADHASLAPVPASSLKVVLPEARDTWPRSFFAVVASSGGVRTLMSVSQEDPWTPYKLSYVATSASDANLSLAPAYVGAVSIDPETPFLILPPAQLATAYADVMDKGDDSEYAKIFDTDTDSDSFRVQVAADRQRRLTEFNETGTETGTMTFSTSAGDTDPAALATLDSGAIVAISVVESDKVEPTNEDAVIKVPDNTVVQTLTGETESKTGFETTFSDQLFFFVPAQSSNQRIQFLGYSSDVLNAKVVGE